MRARRVDEAAARLCQRQRAQRLALHGGKGAGKFAGARQRVAEGDQRRVARDPQAAVERRPGQREHHRGAERQRHPRRDEDEGRRRRQPGGARAGDEEAAQLQRHHGEAAPVASRPLDGEWQRDGHHQAQPVGVALAAVGKGRAQLQQRPEAGAAADDRGGAAGERAQFLRRLRQRRQQQRRRREPGQGVGAARGIIQPHNPRKQAAAGERRRGVPLMKSDTATSAPLGRRRRGPRSRPALPARASSLEPLQLLTHLGAAVMRQRRRQPLGRGATQIAAAELALARLRGGDQFRVINEIMKFHVMLECSFILFFC